MATECEGIKFTTRLGIRFRACGGEEMPITPIESFSPSVSTPYEIIDSIEEDNLGVGAQNMRITFDFSVKGINAEVMREMYAAAINRGAFEIGVVNTNPDQDEWTFDALAFRQCYFTSVTPVEASNEGGVPTMNFSGIGLSVISSNLGSDTVNSKAAYL